MPRSNCEIEHGRLGDHHVEYRPNKMLSVHRRFLDTAAVTLHDWIKITVGLILKTQLHSWIKVRVKIYQIWSQTVFEIPTFVGYYVCRIYR